MGLVFHAKETNTHRADDGIRSIYNYILSILSFPSIIHFIVYSVLRVEQLAGCQNGSEGPILVSQVMFSYGLAFKIVAVFE